jgi:MFS family permease
MTATRRDYSFGLIYLLVFLLSIADALAGYVQSSYLNQFFSLSNVGLIIGLGAAVAIVVSVWLPKLIAKTSLYATGLSLTVLNAGCSLILALTKNPGLVVIFFLVRYLGFLWLLVVLDIFLEKISANKITGFIRSIYLTFINLAWLASPLLMGQLVGLNNYSQIYWAGALIMALFFIVLSTEKNKLKNVQTDKTHRRLDFLASLKRLTASYDLLAVFISVMVLNIFYALAVLYIPIYLNRDLGFSWPIIGIIFTVMLVPFVLLQFPAGVLADKFFGEKEMMMAGNVMMAASLVSIFLAFSREVVFWASLLFLSRVGAALTESMQEIYFYKKVSGRDVGLINLFRQARSVGWLAGALLAFVVLKFMTIPTLFLIVAVILILDTIQLSFIKDTN